MKVLITYPDPHNKNTEQYLVADYIKIVFGSERVSLSDLLKELYELIQKKRSEE